jgi:molybdopterin synthase sulfur carrier subunit
MPPIGQQPAQEKSMAKIRIPTPLRSFTQNKEEVTESGATVGEVLRNLEKRFPGIGARLLDDTGTVRRYVNIFHNDEDIRFLQALETPVSDSDRITIIPAIAGG